MKKRDRRKKPRTMNKESKTNNDRNIITGGTVGAVIGLLFIRGLLDYIRENNMPHNYIIGIYIVIAIITFIGAIMLGRKSRKIKNSLFLCIAIVSFVSLYFLGNLIRQSYPQYMHVYKAPIGIGMIISFVFGVLLLFPLSNNK